MFSFGIRGMAAVLFVFVGTASLAACGGGGGGGLGGAATGSLVTFTTTSVPSATTGMPYTAVVEAVFPHPPGKFKVTAGTIPPGVTFDQSTGTLSGYPNQIGTFHFEIAARDGADELTLGGLLPDGRDASFAEVRRTFTIPVARGLPNILPQVPPAATYRGSYGYQIQVAGGTAPYTFAQVGGTLPNGITVTPTGFLGSFPTQAQPTPYGFDVQVTDANGLTDVEHLEIQVIVLPLIILTSNPLPESAKGFAYDLPLALASAGGGAPYTWSQDPPLPGETDLATIGMQISNSGHLQPLDAGPTSVGSFNFTVRVVDEAGQIASQHLMLKVNLGPVLSTISPNRSSQLPPYTVTGLNFQPGAILIFKPGLTQVTVTPQFIDATTLKINAPVPPPAGAGGAVEVKVVNPDGGFSSKPGAFLYAASTLAFGVKGFVSSPLSSTGLDVADVDGDGKADIVHSGAAGINVYPGSPVSSAAGLQFLRSLGGTPPTFAAPLTLDATNTYDCKFADMNLDGKLDIVALGQATLKVFPGNGLGGFGPAIVSALPAFSFWPSEMTIHRFNSDLIPDVAFGVPYVSGSGNSNGRVYMMVGNGTGSFTLADSAVSTMPAIWGVQSMTSVDTDNDGRGEIVAGTGLNQAGTGPVFYYTSPTSTAGFGTWLARGAITSPLYAELHGCAVGDFLGNNSRQVVTAFTGSPGYAPGNFRLVSLWSGSAVATQQNIGVQPTDITKSVTAIDGDFDTKLDWAITTKPAGILVYRGSTLAVALTLDANAGSPALSGTQTGRIASGDLDGDGRPDLVATTSCWTNETMACYYSTIYALGISGNGGSMGVVFYLNTSN